MPWPSWRRATSGLLLHEEAEVFSASCPKFAGAVFTSPQWKSVVTFQQPSITSAGLKETGQGKTVPRSPRLPAGWLAGPVPQTSRHTSRRKAVKSAWRAIPPWTPTHPLWHRAAGPTLRQDLEGLISFRGQDKPVSTRPFYSSCCPPFAMLEVILWPGDRPTADRISCSLLLYHLSLFYHLCFLHVLF